MVKQVFVVSISMMLLSAGLFTCENAYGKTYLLGPPIVSNPQISDNVLYIALPSGRVYAMDKRTGAQLWRFKNPRYSFSLSPVVFSKNYSSYVSYPKRYPFFSSPIPYEDVIFVVDTRGRVYALDAKNGKSKWHLDIPGKIWNIIYTNLTEHVLICGSNTGLYALDIATRKMLWRFDRLEGESVFLCRPVSNDKQILVSVGKARKWYIISLNSKTGEILQKIDCGSDIALTPPYLTEKEIWVGSGGRIRESGKYYGNIICFEPDTGKMKFKSEEGLGGISVSASRGSSKPVGYKNSLFFISQQGPYQHKEGYFYDIFYANALDMATGKIKWRYKIGRDFAVIDICKGKILLGSVNFGTSGYVYMLDTNNGDLLWKFAFKGSLHTDFVCDDHAVYFKTDSHIYAIDLDNKEIIWEKRLR